MESQITPIFYLVRHGRTVNNGKNLYRGVSNSPDAQLSPAGREDVRMAGLWLKKYGPKFDIAIADDLERTQETAQIVCGILGIKHLITDKRMRPLDVGDYTGKSKDDYPLDEFLKNRSKKIPGGQSLNEFDKTQAAIFDNIFETGEKTGKLILVFCHGSNVSYLSNISRTNNKQPKVGYEGLVNPGGVLMFTDRGIFPLTNKREGTATPMPYKEGTALSGFVSDDENRPPRECWNCRNFVATATGGECNHSLVKIDPQLQVRKVDNGNIAVDERDCCDNFRNKVAS